MKNFIKCQTASRGLAAIFSLSLLFLANFSLAAGFSVSPIMVNLSADKKVVSLKVHNSSNQPTAVQAELMDWRQQDGTDIHQVVTRDLLVSPPIFTISPGETQVIRVGLRRPIDLKQELSYRLFLQEIPPAISDNFQGLRVVMRVGLPVFVEPAQVRTNADLKWKIRQSNTSDLILHTENQGNGHAKVTELRLKLPNGQELVQRGNFYILPGSQREWSITSKVAHLSGGTVTLIIKNQGKTVTRELRLE